MKTYTLSLIVLFFIGINTLNSQSRMDNKHKLSLGFGAYTPAVIKYNSFFKWNEDYQTSVSTIYHLKYEYSFNEKVKGAISLSNVNIRGKWNGKSKDGSGWGLFDFSDPNGGYYTVSSTSIVGRVNFSFYQTEKLETYFGLGAGYRFDNYHESVVNSEVYGLEDSGLTIPISMELGIGIRYYFLPNLGIYSEMGLAKSFIQAGVMVGF